MVGRFYLSSAAQAVIRQAQAEVRRKLMVARNRRPTPVAQPAPVSLVIGREVL